MYYPPNPSLGDVYINEDSETCIYTGVGPDGPNGGWDCNGGTVPPPGGPGGLIILSPATQGQTVFPLGMSLANPNDALLFVNGLRANSGEYNFDVTYSILYWLNVDYELGPEDNIELKYF